MERVYHHTCLSLIRGISRALDQMEAQDYEAAKKTLLDIWDQSVGAGPSPGPTPSEDPPTSYVLK